MDRRDQMPIARASAHEKGERCADFLRLAARFFSRHGIGRIERAISDNGSGYRSKHFAQALFELEARHKRTRPYTPRTNGKPNIPERMIEFSRYRNAAKQIASRYSTSMLSSRRLVKRRGCPGDESLRVG